jgi:polysaccharide deacetylase family protein (PEP-CTERM system associated)
VLRAKGLLEDLGGGPVQGYRAPSFSIGDGNPWAFDVLLDAGHRYSSSVYPVRHDHYGSPDAPRFAYDARPGLLEIPLTTTRVLGQNLPAGGGGYFRLAPYSLSRWALRRVNEIDRQPAIFYMHPWEIDPDQPRVPGTGLKTRFRHYVNLHKTESRLGRLLRDFRWGRIDEVFGLPLA